MFENGNRQGLRDMRREGLSDSASCLLSPVSCPTLISILVRTRNDAPHIVRTLDAIAAQACPIPHEVLVCDDASTDGTGELLASRTDIRLVPRPEGPYRPGRTLNALVREAKGEIVVFNNADAIPLDADWLRALTAPLATGAADATFANQLPRPDATPLVRKDSERAFGDGSVSARWPRFFSLASSAAHRADLLANPFDEMLLYSEDVEWANRRAGFRRRYVAAARVEHSHNYTRTQLARRFYGEGYADQQIFGDPVPCRPRVVLQAGLEVLRDLAYLMKTSRLSPRIVADAVVRRLVQRLSWWRGMRDAANGHRPRSCSTAAADSSAPSPEPSGRPVSRILFTGVYPNFHGGLERFAARAAETLRSAGCKVDCAGDVPRSLKPYDLVVMQKIPRRLMDLRRLICRYGDRLRFYAHDHELYCLRRHYYDPFRRPCRRVYSFLPCRLCAAVTRPKWIPRALMRDMAGFLREMRSVRTFVQGDYMRTNLLKCGFAADRLATVAPFWTDAARIRTDFMPRRADGSRPLRVLYVGQLVAGKGVRILVEAVARLTIPCTLTVVGAGRDERRLRALAAKAPDGTIRFEGWRTDVPRYLEAADVVVVPSLWNEPFCMVGVESLAAGVPVVAFNRGGIGDWLKPDETGLFAEPTVEGLMAALTAMANPATLERLSRTAGSFVRANYSTDRFLKGLFS